MRRILITGVSGVGKSTVLAALSARGLRAVDTDYGGYCSPDPAAPPPKPTAEPGWVWYEARIRALLDEETGDALFVGGCVPNQGRFYPEFDRVVLLTAPPATVRRRLAERPGNDYGKRPGELERALADQAEVEPLLRAGATAVVDTDAPLADVVDAIVAHAFG
ncbi:AAA family ATPase [Glycomyces paridis]|uniref:Shikimate kinase n=1 Tax=Glycomyces paridis TaxID=2126555 RepID=A0A4S8P8F6_9ACTN|nr:AAA family ATPase [Glycomyces paridis]THV25961.1 hypothetical protein E9998_19705 [Glycomyces paridis]